MAKADAGNLADVIMKELREYRELKNEEMEEIAKEVAAEGRKKLKATSPRGSGSRKGHYADGWSVKAVKSGNGKFSFTIHNRKKPGLTHLLVAPLAGAWIEIETLIYSKFASGRRSPRGSAD